MRVAASTTGVDKTTSVVATEVKDERRFSRSSLAVVLFAALLVLLGLGFKAYRFTLPTEGWSFQLDFEKGLIFDQNLLGVSSPLQQGDILLNVAGESMDENDPFAPPNPEAQAAYRAGNTVQYQVQREGETKTFDVLLSHWTAAGIAKAFWQVVLNRVSQFSPFVLLQLAIAMFVFIKRPNNLAAQLLLLSNVGSVVSGVNWVAAVVSPGDALDPLARVTSYLFGMAINPALLVPLFLHLALIFPKPKWGFQKSVWPVTLLYGLPLILYSLRDFHIMPNLPADVFVPLYFLLSIVAFIYSLVKVKDSEQRAQIKWVVYGGAIQAFGSLLWVSSAILQWLPWSTINYLQWFPWDFIFPLCLAIAILKYRLFDIDLIINRTLVYGTLSLGVVGLYLGLVTGSSYLLQTQSNLAVSLVAVAIILFLLRPSYQLLQRSANRFIPVTPVHYSMATASSEFMTSIDAENVSTQPPSRENQRPRSARLVIIFAIALLLLSLAQKAYRFTLPTEGWSAITDFEDDNPVFVKNLLGVPSELQAGDKVMSVEGIPFTTLLEQTSRGQPNDLNYEIGQTLHYTVLRDGKEVAVNVPLYTGTSLDFGTILWQFFTNNGVGDLMMWLRVLVTVFIFWKRPNNLTAQLLFLQIIATIASAISWTVTPLSVAEVLRPSTYIVAVFFSHWIHLTLEQPLGLHVILSFPKPHPLLQKRWTLPLLYGLPFLVFALGAFSFSILPAFTPFLVVALYNLLGIVFVLRMFFTKRNPVETAQVRWFSFGYALSSLGMVIFGLSVAGLIPDTVSTAAELIPFNLIYLLCIAIAILRYRLFDIDVILNRTLVYGSLSAGVIGLYALVVGGVGRLVQGQGDVVLSLFATGFIAVIFNPLRNRLQRFVNHLLYGERDEPYSVLSKLSSKMEGTLEPSKLLPTMTETIANVLKLPYAAIALGQNSNMQIVASHGTAKSTNVVLPLAYQGETVGELRLEPRAGETFKTPELNLLKTIAQQASVAAYTVKQNLDLQHSREALVTAREEERLRIRRDLHDGLGPELASLTLKLDATRNVLKNDTNKAEKQDAIASIRRLVYALRPPALDELGLEGALREQARSYDHVLNIELKTIGDLINLPAAVEVACYRITQEALTNVVRHSRAKHCTIILCAADKLFIEVQDDGIGLSEHYRSGVGLRSMRERAEELGGTFTVTSSERGTRLLATLPLFTEGRTQEVAIT
jgi:signal transduction histidine kinase